MYFEINSVNSTAMYQHFICHQNSELSRTNSHCSHKHDTHNIAPRKAKLLHFESLCSDTPYFWTCFYRKDQIIVQSRRIQFWTCFYRSWTNTLVYCSITEESSSSSVAPLNVAAEYELQVLWRLWTKQVYCLLLQSMKWGSRSE